jgi:uncharacterized membrane protein YhiD involved in acid resistance
VIIITLLIILYKFSQLEKYIKTNNNNTKIEATTFDSPLDKEVLQNIASVYNKSNLTNISSTKNMKVGGELRIGFTMRNPGRMHITSCVIYI